MKSLEQHHFPAGDTAACDKVIHLPSFRIPCSAIRIQNYRAFSMVEISLALAVIGIALVSILGLLAVGLNTSRDATDDNMASQIVRDVVADRRSTPYTEVTPAISATSFNIPALSVFPVGGYALYFKKGGGKPLDPTVAPGSQPAGYYYEVDMKVNPSSPTDLAFVDIRVSWPAGAPMAKRTTYFYTTVFSNDQ